MKPGEAIVQLVRLGYRFEVAGGRIRYQYKGAGKPDPGLVRHLLGVLKTNKDEAVKYLAKAQNTGDIPSCNDCPWCMENPWTHYPELPKWCGWWWDHLLADNPQCRDRREGRVPDPEPKAQPDNHKTPKRTRPETAPGTCYDCRHFQPAASSPNPTQAWGRCRHLGKGRYGVARACDAFQLARNTNHREKEKACRK